MRALWPAFRSLYPLSFRGYRDVWPGSRAGLVRVPFGIYPKDMNMKHRLRIIVIAGCVVVATAAIVLYNHFSSRPGIGDAGPVSDKAPVAAPAAGRPVPVEVHVAALEPIDAGIGGLGKLLANEEVEIVSEIAGKVEKIQFSEGAKVRAGDLLVKVNDDDLQAQLSRAEFQRRLLSDKLDRNRILFEKDAVSGEAFDQIETDYNMVEADIRLLKVKIDKTEIKAPFDGVIGFRYISLGSYLQPSTPIAQLVDHSKLRVEVAIPAQYLDASLIGAPLMFTVRGDDTPRRARVYAIDPRVDDKTKTIILRGLYDNADGRLLPNMSVTFSISQRQGRSLQVPTEAIVPEIDRQRVWVVRKGRAVPVAVTTGVRNERMIEITDGIAAGDSVIVTGLMQVRDGARVEVVSTR